MYPFVKWSKTQCLRHSTGIMEIVGSIPTRKSPFLKEFLRHCHVTSITWIPFFISVVRRRTRNCQKVQRSTRPMSYNIRQSFRYSRSCRKQKRWRWQRKEIWSLFLRFSKCACADFVFRCEPMRTRAGTIRKLKRLFFQIHRSHLIKSTPSGPSLWVNASRIYE